MNLRGRIKGHTCFHEVGEGSKVYDKFRLHEKTASKPRMGGLLHVSNEWAKGEGVSETNRTGAKAEEGEGTGSWQNGLQLLWLQHLA